MSIKASLLQRPYKWPSSHKTNSHLENRASEAGGAVGKNQGKSAKAWYTNCRYRVRFKAADRRGGCPALSRDGCSSGTGFVAIYLKTMGNNNVSDERVEND